MTSIVACECGDMEMQERMLSWYRCKRRYGFMYLEISKDIPREMLQRRRVTWEDRSAEVDGKVSADIH